MGHSKNLERGTKMIKIEKLNKSFDEKNLFNNFDLEIKSGEFIVFSGVSGCGKTTLLNMIGALEKFDSGEILVNGIDISKKKNHILYFKNIVGFLFQNFALMENKTVLENMKIVKSNIDSTVSIDSALKRVGLVDKKNEKVFKLSGGEQQRIALARLMIKKCELILADEPTGSLDKKNADDVMSILCELNKSGKTVIVVTHDSEIKKLGQRVIDL
jgi:putative ABC transport system ATP-binding protein